MDESGGYQVTLNATFFQHFSENYNATTHGTTCLRIYLYEEFTVTILPSLPVRHTSSLHCKL